MWCYPALKRWGECRLFSIDPPTARDLDDALSIQPLPGGNFRVGVHIADVAHFVRYSHLLSLWWSMGQLTCSCLSACGMSAGSVYAIDAASALPMI